MAWWSAPAANIAQWGANVNQALGDSYGAQNLRNLSGDIRDPNKVYTGGTDVYNGKSFSQVPSTSSAPKNSYTQSPIQNETRLSNAGYGGGGSGGGYDPQVESARYNLQSQENQYNSALGRLDGQLNTAIGNIQGDYTNAYNQLTGQRDVARRDNQTAVNNQLQDYQTARDSVNSNTRNLLSGARRLLGSQGAGGGSADLFAAPLAAQQEGNNQNAQVKQTNERNLAALTTAYNDNENKFNSSFSDLARNRDQSIRDTQSQFENQRADILGSIGALSGQRALLNGQNYQAAMAAAAPYASRVQGILNTIDSLAARPTGIQAQNVALSAPDLAQYNLGRFDAPAVAAQDPTLGAAAPNAYNVLAGLGDDRRQQLV